MRKLDTVSSFELRDSSFVILSSFVIRHSSFNDTMSYATILRHERFTFGDLREVFAKANEEKSGDQLAGIAARSERERVAAKCVLADIRLGEIVDQPIIDPDTDDVSRLILDTLDQEAFRAFRSLTVGEFRERLLATDGGIPPYAITPEIAAAVAK